MLQGLIIVFRWPQKQTLYFEQGQIENLLFSDSVSVSASKNEGRIRETDGGATRALNVSSDLHGHYNCKTASKKCTQHSLTNSQTLFPSHKKIVTLKQALRERSCSEFSRCCEFFFCLSE